MPGTRHTPARRVGAEGKGQGSEGGLQLEGSVEGAVVCVCVCVCVCLGPCPRSHSRLRRALYQGGASLTPCAPRVVSQWGGLPGIQGAGSTTLPNQPCGGGATSLWADPEQPRTQTGEPEKGSSERVNLWSSWLRECVLCVGVGVWE